MTESLLIVVRALVGPRPVYTRSSWTAEREISAFGLPLCG